MLSPGEFWKEVPKDREANRLFRQDILSRALTDPALQEIEKQKCAQDLLYYINAYLFQFNPRKLRREIGPFITWPFQDEGFRVMLDCIYCTCPEQPEPHQHDLVIEKSREMGASWMLLIAFEWLWHFHPLQTFNLISRNEKAVESDKSDSLFWKIDFMHRYQPAWLMPKKWRRSRLFFGNDDLDCQLYGEASTGKAGVGGRATAMGIDEFSQIEEDYEVLHRTSDTTGCRIFNFTHLGLDTAAYELTQDPNKRKLRLHWSQHPDKIHGLYQYREAQKKVIVLDTTYAFPPDFDFVMDGKLRSPWYDEQCKRKGSSRAVAMDLDIDPRGSVAQVFDSLTIRQLQAEYAIAPYFVGELDYDSDSGRPQGFLPLESGRIKLWCRLDADNRPPPGKYGMGCDVATGTGATPSCLSVIDGTTGEKVLEYGNPFILPEHLGPLAVALCWLFKDDRGEPAKMCWESAGPGGLFGQRVMALNFRNVYYKTNEKALFGQATNIPGWYPGNDNKRAVIEDYRSALHARRLINRSVSALEECLNFKYDSRGNIAHGEEESRNDPTGARVNHGDQTIADALAWKMVRDVQKVQKQQQDRRPQIGTLAWRRELADNQRQLQEEWA